MNTLFEHEYILLVTNIINGKRLPDAIYIHKSAFKTESITLKDFIASKINSMGVENYSWNIIKLFKKEFKASLLYYPDFFTSSYPALQTSVILNFIDGTYKRRNYEFSDNPPILHRKETFLLPNHPMVPLFQELTREGEAAGLYKNSRLIGFKKNWQELIEKQGYKLVNGRLIGCDNNG